MSQHGKLCHNTKGKFDGIKETTLTYTQESKSPECVATTNPGVATKDQESRNTKGHMRQTVSVRRKEV
ncbi:hypothetical protein PVK06_008111 [Gossypium arboreum]|uniref:Uncharacterized protein n=1 Tax=Gossypium arboreum TaxID=29729 RepID=A0ABR0QJ44_GOSAR|nr:hypothetical protein PVK06_008111 [Gossypium arboreum]